MRLNFSCTFDVKRSLKIYREIVCKNVETYNLFNFKWAFESVL